MAARDLTLILRAKDEASQTLSNISGSLGSVAKVAAGAAVGIGVAAAGVAAASISMAAGFEKGMREVATLTPEVADNFKAMSNDVLELSSRMGTDAVDSTKALYQAISAGVPAGNAIEFLEVATKAAIGGVTDTETAVDGLTTVLNAFKMDADDVGKVADIMFTTVKQGKTDFGQLSGALFNVAPIAKTAGVSFEEVSASIATLTKQGTPTSVATTQIRAAIQGLLKPSADMTAIFNDLGYETAAAAIEAKGLQFALDAVRNQAGGDVGQMQKLLGSVEAVSAALGVTGENAEMFAGDLAAMQDAAGASDAAFEEMSKSFDHQMSVLQTTLKNLMITIGMELLPIITPVIEQIGKVLPGAFNAAKDAIVPVVQNIAATIKPIFDGIMDVADILYHTFAAIFAGDLGGAMDTFFEGFYDYLDTLGIDVGATKEAVWEFIQSLSTGFQQARDTVVPVIQEIAAWVKDNLHTVMAGLGAMIVAIVVPAFIAWAASAVAAAAATVAALAPVLIPLAAIGLAVGALYYVWTENLFGIRDILTGVWNNTLLPTFNTIKEWLGVTIPVVIQTLSNFWTNTLLPAIQAVAGFVGDNVVPVLKLLADVGLLGAELAAKALAGLWEKVLLPALTEVWRFLGADVLPILRDVAAFLSDVLGPVVGWFTETMVKGLTSALGTLRDSLRWVADRLGDLKGALSGLTLPDWLTPGSPTPLEVGIRGIAQATGDLTSRQLPGLQSGLALGDSPLAGQSAIDYDRLANAMARALAGTTLEATINGQRTTAVLGLARSRGLS